MRQNIPSILTISENEIIELDEIISFTIEHDASSAGTLQYNFNGSFGIGKTILPGDAEPWSVEDGGSFKGQKLVITCTGTAYLKTIVRGPEIKDC